MIVYLLTNSVNGKYYVGKTVNPNLMDYLSVKRWAVRHGKHQSMPLIRAMTKYGIGAFIPEVLTVADTSEQLDMLERLWIASLGSRDRKVGYNLTAGGDTSRLGLHNSEEHNKRIADANRGRKPAGYVRTERHRQQLRERMMGNTVGKYGRKGKP